MNELDEDMEMRVLDLLEPGADVSDESWLMSGDAVPEAYRDLLAVKQVLQEQHTSVNLDEQWKQWQGRADRRTTRRPRMLVTVLLGAAASIAAAAILFVWLLPNRQPVQQPLAKSQGIVVYQVDGAPQQVTITRNNGQQLTVTAQMEQQLDIAEQASRVVDTLTVSVPKGGSYTVKLADGSRVMLHAGSQLTFPTVFEGPQREVNLHGEAYFIVDHQPTHPFVVNAGRWQTTVLGTEFNVRSFGRNDEEVTLITGRVNVSNHRHEVTLQPGQQVSQTVSGELDTRTVSLDYYTYWRDGYLYFDNEELQKVMAELGRSFNCNVSFNRSDLLKTKVHFVAEREAGVDAAIRSLNQMKIAKVLRHGNVIIVE